MDPLLATAQPDKPSPSEVQRRAAWGAGYKAAASAITPVVGFARSVLLARILMPDDYGVVTFALFFSNLVGSLTQFGFRQAFIHSDQEDEDRRLLYVAVTRAKELLFMSFPQTTQTRDFQRIINRPSRFLSGLPEMCFDEAVLEWGGD